MRTVAVNEAGLHIGEGHQNCKYTDGEMVLKLRDEGMSYGAIAELVEMPKSTVQSICNARRRCQTAARWKNVEG
jgi:DNA-directed RNA polymerase specialized sigma24 family protein